MPSWVREKNSALELDLVIQPQASRSEIVGPYGEPPRLKVRIAAPAVEGAANEELLRFLKSRLEIPTSALEVIQGLSSRRKTVRCQGIARAEAISRLGTGT